MSGPHRMMECMCSYLLHVIIKQVASDSVMDQPLKKCNKEEFSNFQNSTFNWKLIGRQQLLKLRTGSVQQLSKHMRHNERI